MRQYFHPIVACTEDTGYKPSPLPIIYCVVDMKLDPGEVAYVGDTVSDIMAAKNAGVKSIYINRFSRPIKDKPDYEIDSLERLSAIVNGTK
jgi:phosphoglycolate phosphatase